MAEEKTIVDEWIQDCVRVGGIDEEGFKILIAKSTKSYQEGFAKGQTLGIKTGLEVAKAVCKREGYEFTFPDPESIKIEEEKKNK